MCVCTIVYTMKEQGSTRPKLPYTAVYKIHVATSKNVYKRLLVCIPAQIKTNINVAIPAYSSYYASALYVM